MKSIKLKKVGYWMSVITLGIVVGISLQFAAAWTEPTVAPPGGNLGAPFNTSATPQNKAGSFSSSGSISAAGAIRGSQVCIGMDCRAVWPSSGATPVASGLYGMCKEFSSGAPCASSASPAFCSSGYTCACPSGYTLMNITTGEANIHVIKYTSPNYVFSCLKQ